MKRRIQLDIVMIGLCSMYQCYFTNGVHTNIYSIQLLLHDQPLIIKEQCFPLLDPIDCESWVLGVLAQRQRVLWRR